MRDGAIAVVPGLFGQLQNSVLDVIGRGYTDVTAALLAAGVGSTELVIWKEVDGIFEADPARVIGARCLPRISSAEAAELTYYGSQVVHPLAMELAMSHGVRLRIKNAAIPDAPGTTVEDDAGNSLERHGRPTAVTVKDGITVLTVQSNRKAASHGFLSELFSLLNKYGIVADLVATSEVNVSIAIPQERDERALSFCINDLRTLGKVCGLQLPTHPCQVSIKSDMAILSLVGREMRSTVGVSGQLFDTLASKGVNVDMISQGASEINISCVIDAREADAALACVHGTMIKGK